MPHALRGRGRVGVHGDAGKALLAARWSMRYSGRKSWPQSLMQWASSMAKNESGTPVAGSRASARSSAARATDRAASAGRRGSRRRRGACSSVASVLLTQAAGTPQSIKRIDLVLHQRDQRRDDDRQPRHRQGRGLKAERLAAAGRQHDDRVAAREHRTASPRPAAAGTRRSPSSGAQDAQQFFHGLLPEIAQVNCELNGYRGVSRAYQLVTQPVYANLPPPRVSGCRNPPSAPYNSAALLNPGPESLAPT